jgi:signal transduction histidine kinase
MARVDLAELIEDAILLLRRQALANRVRLRVEIAGGLPRVLGDRVQLQQVIINLAINGIEAMTPVDDRPRELRLRAQPCADGRVLVAVRDTGVGIEPDHADRLFSAFYTTKAEGLGMGLSICRSIVEAHGGEIWVTNNSGPGATIQLTLRRYLDNL